jgi:hypothetical protein
VFCRISPKLVFVSSSVKRHLFQVLACLHCLKWVPITFHSTSQSTSNSTSAIQTHHLCSTLYTVPIFCRKKKLSEKSPSLRALNLAKLRQRRPRRWLGIESGTMSRLPRTHCASLDASTVTQVTVKIPSPPSQHCIMYMTHCQGTDNPALGRHRECHHGCGLTSDTSSLNFKGYGRHVVIAILMGPDIPVTWSKGHCVRRVHQV